MLRMLTLLEDCELLGWRNRALLKLIRDICEFVVGLFSHSMPGLCVAARPLILDAAGVLSIGSSMSLSTAMSSDESSESEPESIILMLLTELDRLVLSPWRDDHVVFWLGESRIEPVLPSPLLCGMLIPRPVIGEASGEVSARVEWCRFVQALAKSSPLDLLGRTEAGEPYMLDESSFGERGIRGLVVESPSDLSLVGICSDSPLMW